MLCPPMLVSLMSMMLAVKSWQPRNVPQREECTEFLASSTIDSWGIQSLGPATLYHVPLLDVIVFGMLAL